MTNKIVLEVCAFTIQSCMIAEKAGAVRVELCDNPVEGGTNPSYGTIRRVREKIGIRLYPILRPRSGNYCYDEDEFAIMREDIRVCRELGCDGISVGVQKIDGTIDIERMRRVVEWAYPMGVTCNRAFDAVPDPFQALEEIIDCGCERVLTSGQKASAPEGAAVLAKLVQQAANRISIMPGAGVRSSNIAQLIRDTGAREYHTSARKTIPNPLTWQTKEITDYGNVYIADETELRAILELMQ